MTGSSTTTFSWMLLLTLLALFIFSSPAHVLRLPREINTDVKALELCSKEKTHHQLNISVPQQECPFPYFIAGIESLNCSSQLIRNLLARLDSLNKMCQSQNNNCVLNVNYTQSVKPLELYEKLISLVEENNSKSCYNL